MLKSVPDPRIDRQKRHLLSDILAIAVLTYVSGGDGFRDMERYGRKHEARLGEFLCLRNGIPSHDTFRRVLSMVRPAVMGVCVRLWQRAAAGRMKGGKPERRCFITSLKADARAFRKLVRRHWGVENRLHWVLDVVFLEDLCRARTGHAPENCSTLRKIALMLLRRNAIGGMGVGPMRKECAWDFDSARKVFLGGEGEEVAA